MSPRSIHSFCRLMPCMTTAFAMIGLLASGCISVSSSSSLKPEVVSRSKHGGMNFRLKTVSREMDMTHDTGMRTGGGYAITEHSHQRIDDWSELRSNIEENLGHPDPSLLTVDVNIKVRERMEDVEDAAKLWTVMPAALTLFTFPWITTVSDSCQADVEFLINGDYVGSSYIHGDMDTVTWFSWLTLPIAIFQSEDCTKAAILSKAIAAELTPERHGEIVESFRKAQEAERIAREEAERIAREKAEAERIAREKAEAERVARKEAERIAREKAEAERIAREEAAEREWLAQKDDPNYKFPLRSEFPSSSPVYKAFQTGCALEWAEECIQREGYATTNRVRSFPDLAVGVPGATERPLPGEFNRVNETETSLFVHSPTNLTFADDGRVVTLTFGSPFPDGSRRVLVSGEIHFPDGGATVDALTKKYESSLPDCRRKDFEETVREGGQTILPLVRLPVLTTRKALVVLSSDKAAIRILDNRAISLFWDTPSSQQIHVDETGKVSLSNDDLELRIIAAPQLSGEEVGKALSMWESANVSCGKPAVSIVDLPLFTAMSAAKDEHVRTETDARRKEREDAAERRRREMEKRLESF